MSTLVRIPEYQVLCETLVPGDILELTSSPEDMPFTIERTEEFHLHPDPGAEALVDLRKFFPSILRSQRDCTIFYVEETVAYSEELGSWLREGEFDVLPWERFIRLRSVEFELFWITTRAFHLFRDSEGEKPRYGDYKIDCFVNGRAVNAL